MFVCILWGDHVTAVLVGVGGGGGQTGAAGISGGATTRPRPGVPTPRAVQLGEQTWDMRYACMLTLTPSAHVMGGEYSAAACPAEHQQSPEYPPPPVCPISLPPVSLPFRQQRELQGLSGAASPTPPPGIHAHLPNPPLVH